jgi:flagellar biosynthetic protein FliR
MSSIVGALASILTTDGIDLAALGLAWARATPLVVLVPAFGLRALPAPGRALIALVLAASVFPAIPSAAASSNVPWALLAVVEVLRGLPVALAATIPLWAATMAGGIVDALRASQDTLLVPTIEGRPTTLGAPLSLLASAIFLASGGPARATAALAAHGVTTDPLLAAADDITGGIALAVSLAGPILAAAVVVEIAAALIARAAAPAQVHALLAPIRALGILTILAAVLERITSALTRVVP